MGKHQIRLLKFAIKYPGWHTYGTDRSTVDAVNSLQRLEFIETNGNRQFRLKRDEQPTPEAIANSASLAC